MARNGVKTGGRDWKPGQSGNPERKGLSDPAATKIRQLTRAQIAEIGTVVLDGSLEDLNKIVTDPKASALRVWIATIIVDGIKQGDVVKLNALLDRIAGKVKQEIGFGPNSFDPSGVKGMSDEVLEVEYRKLLANPEP